MLAVGLAAAACSWERTPSQRTSVNAGRNPACSSPTSAKLARLHGWSGTTSAGVAWRSPARATPSLAAHAGHRAGECLRSYRRHLRDPSRIRAEESLTTPRFFAASIALTLMSRARHSLSSAPKARPLRTRQASLKLRTAQSLPFKRFQRWASTPAVSPDAASLPPSSWQLPGPLSHRQATTSLSLSGHQKGITSDCLARTIGANRKEPCPIHTA